MEKQEKQAIEILHMMCGNNGCVISDSGGKDSSVLKHIALKTKNMYGFDQWGSTTIINRLEDRWDVIPIGQGTKTMTQVINDFENLLVDERLIIAENECFRFMAKNCIAVYDEMLGVKYSKKKSKFKIDGVIAMLMGLLLCIEENGIQASLPVK